jgi:hypothetical protein
MFVSIFILLYLYNIQYFFVLYIYIVFLYNIYLYKDSLDKMLFGLQVRQAHTIHN